MASTGSQQHPPIGPGPVGSFFLGLYRFLASLRLAVFLLVVLAAILAVATVLESGWGAEFVLWYIYRSAWFIGLETLLAANILAATLIRYPWGWRRLGFVVTHAGLLTLMAGAIQTFFMGIEGNIEIEEGKTFMGIDGNIEIEEGETGNLMNINTDSQFTLLVGGQTEEEATKFSFQPGPVDWKKGRTHNFGGSKKDVGLEVLKFYRHARFVEDWVEDKKDPQASAVRFALWNPSGQVAVSDWLDTRNGTERHQAGPLQFRFIRAPVASMRDDFLSPPSYDAMGEKGVLSVHFNGKMERLSVDENLDKTVAIGDSGLKLELTEYAADLPHGHTSVGGPQLVLQVHLPGKDEPTAHRVFAADPFFDVDRGSRLPVKFSYHHRAALAAMGVELLQTPEGELFARVGARVDDRVEYRSQGRVDVGDRIEIVAGFIFEVLEHLPYLHLNTDLEKVKPKWGEKFLPEAAALVEVTVDGKHQEVWLQRNTPGRNYQSLRLGDKDVSIRFGYRTRPMGFDVTLLDFERKLNPGGVGTASFSSKIQLTDEDAKVDREHTISMNRPLTYGKYTLYQHSFGGATENRSTLAVAYDPGRALKYSGSVMMCVGIFIMCYMRKRRVKKDKGWAPPAS